MSGPRLASLQYRVIRSLGVGAGSTILLIVEPQTSRKFALKVVRRLSPRDDVYIRQAIHEHEVSQRLRHPNLVRIYDHRIKHRWLRTSGVELLLEYVEGQNLDELEVRSLKELIALLVQVAAGLRHMHRKNVFHGDLKPSNIMVSSASTAKIIDFGTAWIRGQQKDRVQGTPQYMAPEQASRKTVDAHTDIYNLGATMYRMLTGHYANLAGMPHEIEGAVLHWAKPKPPVNLNRNIPLPLSQLTMECLEQNPERRPPSMDDVLQRLARLAQELNIALPPESLEGALPDDGLPL